MVELLGVSSVIRVAFLITERLYSSDRGVWDDPYYFAGLVCYTGEFGFVFGRIFKHKTFKVNSDRRQLRLSVQQLRFTSTLTGHDKQVRPKFSPPNRLTVL